MEIWNIFSHLSRNMFALTYKMNYFFHRTQHLQKVISTHQTDVGEGLGDLDGLAGDDGVGGNSEVVADFGPEALGAASEDVYGARSGSGGRSGSGCGSGSLGISGSGSSLACYSASGGLKLSGGCDSQEKDSGDLQEEGNEGDVEQTAFNKIKSLAKRAIYGTLGSKGLNK